MKGVGYLISALSVFLLGAVAWPKPDDPSWKVVALTCGIMFSIFGLVLRFLSHLNEKDALAYAEKEADEAQPK